MKRITGALPLGMLVLFFAVGCSLVPKTGIAENSASDQLIPIPHDPLTIAALIRDEFQTWRGTPHRLGGQGSRGIDCSGLAQQIFSQAFAISLPRTTKSQAGIGIPLQRRDLQPGDLVFFRTSSYPRHVGVYVGNGEFVHASSSKGVIISRMDRGYWQRHYWMARRVVRSVSV